MSRAQTFYLIAFLAVSLTGTGWFFLNDNEEILPEEISQVEPCNSCTARHSNLTRLREAGGLTAISDE